MFRNLLSYESACGDLYSILNSSNETIKYDETRLEINERCKIFKNILKKHYNKMSLAVVSHAYFISTFIADEVDEFGIIKNRRRIQNCEVIEYTSDSLV